MSQVAVILFVDEKIQLPTNLISLFEASKEKRDCNGLCLEVRRYSNLDEVMHHSDGQAWLLAANGNGFRMTKTARFTPVSFRPTNLISPSIKNIIVVDLNRNKNPEGMLSNVFAWLVKASSETADKPFYGSPKQSNKKSRNRGSGAYFKRQPVTGWWRY